MGVVRDAQERHVSSGCLNLFTVPPLGTICLAGLRADLISEMINAPSADAVVGFIAWLTEAAGSSLTSFSAVRRAVLLRRVWTRVSAFTVARWILCGLVSCGLLRCRDAIKWRCISKAYIRNRRVFTSGKRDL